MLIELVEVSTVNAYVGEAVDNCAIQRITDNCILCSVEDINAETLRFSDQ